MGESQISPRYSQVQDTGESQISPRYSQVQDMGESQISSQVQDTGESQISPGYSQVQDTDESQICPEYSQVHKPAKDFRIDGNQGTEGEDLLYDRVSLYICYLSYPVRFEFTAFLVRIGCSHVLWRIYVKGLFQ